MMTLGCPTPEPQGLPHTSGPQNILTTPSGTSGLLPAMFRKPFGTWDKTWASYMQGICSSPLNPAANFLFLKLEKD